MLADPALVGHVLGTDSLIPNAPAKIGSEQFPKKLQTKTVLDQLGSNKVQIFKAIMVADGHIQQELAGTPDRRQLLEVGL